MDPKTTGAFIAQLRKEKHYTQKELALLLDVSDKAISRWETGKGYPDTTLLQPLSKALGVTVGELLSGQRFPKETLVQKNDQILVSSIACTVEQRTIIHGLCFLLAAILVIGIVAGLIAWLPPSAVNFVNKSSTTMYYQLGKNQDGMIYPEFSRTKYGDLLEYRNDDGTRRFVFAEDPNSPENPIMTYQHISGEGMLFGFYIGQTTVIKANSDAGIQSTSLRSFLEENGFVWQYDDNYYGRTRLIYVDGYACHWYPYVKDNVLINICLSALEGNKLIGFDIGLIDESMTSYYEQMAGGFPLTLKDPEGLVTETPAATYHQWEEITIVAQAPENGKTLHLFVNDQLVGKFTPKFPPDSGLLEIKFSMPGVPTTIRVTTQSE